MAGVRTRSVHQLSWSCHAIARFAALWLPAKKAKLIGDNLIEVDLLATADAAEINRIFAEISVVVARSAQG